MIKAHFGPIPAAVIAAAAADVPVPDRPGTRYTVATDTEASNDGVGVFDGWRARSATSGAYRQQTVERTFTGLLSQRLAEIAQKPDAPFLDGADDPRDCSFATTEVTDAQRPRVRRWRASRA